MGLKEVSIVKYLESKGHRFKKDGRYMVTNSPFTRDSTPSFTVFPDNYFKCYSSGEHGSVLTLAFKLDGGYDRLKKIDGVWVPPKIVDKPTNPFLGRIPEHYLKVTDEEKEAIIRYAASRKITVGFVPGVYFDRDKNRYPSLGFPHLDTNSKVCGVKFRNINAVEPKDRFRVRGELGFYVVTNILESFEPVKLYLVESETSTNSFWEYCKATGRNVVIMSAGAVSCPPREIPTQYASLDKYLIIDYDGDKDKYQKRLEKYSHLNMKPIRLVLPKGEDINSLYCKNEIELIENLL